MNEQKLSRETTKALDRLVERVARKLGDSEGGETYKEHLQRKFEQNIDKAKQKAQKYRHKLSLKSSNRDFADEISTYLKDGVAELMSDGMSESEALCLTMNKFDEAELAENFDEFMNAFNDFGVEEWKMQQQQWYTQHGEAIGMLFGGFTILGCVLGALIGFLASGGIPAFLTDSGWIYTLIGLAAGVMTGTGFALIASAFITANKRTQA